MLRFIKITLIIFILLSLSSFSGADVKVGNKAPEFSLKDTEGNLIQLSDYQGKNPVLLDFFTTWCPSCIKYLDEINRCYSAYEDKGLKVFGIDIQEPQSKVKRLIKKHNLNYPVLLDTEAEAASSYKVLGVPYIVIIDKKGFIGWSGHVLDNEAREMLKQVLD
jgi:peroxiredoxin